MQRFSYERAFFQDWANLRWIVIPAIWVLIAILAPQVAIRNFVAVGIVGLGIALAGVVCLLRWPGLGFPLLIVAGLVVPLRISTGTQTSINVSLLLVIGMIGLWVLEMVGRDRAIRLIRSPVVLPSFLFIAISGLAFLFGQLNWFPTRPASIFAQIGGLMIIIFAVGTLLVTAHRLTDVVWLKWAVWLLIIVGGTYIICFLVPPLRRIANRLFQRAVLDSLFWTWITVLAFSQAYLNTKLAIRWRILAGVVAAASFYTVFIVKQAWTSGWLPAAIALFVVVFLTRPRFAIGGAVLVGLFALVRSQAVNDVILGGDNAYSLSTRLEAWKILWDIIQLNPIFGLGPANYYWYTPFYSILGYSVSFNSHNNYIDIVAQTGLLGLGFFFWIMIVVLRTGWKLKSRVPEGFEKAYVYATLGGVVGTLAAGMLGDWILPFVYNVGMEGFRSASLAWFFMGGLIFLGKKYLSGVDGAEEMAAP